jgi:hypothetical protein
MPRLPLLLAALAAVLAAGCGGEAVTTGVYGYILDPRAPDQVFIRDEDGQRYAVRFDPDSDEVMMEALENLKADIRMPGADGHRIFLVGEHSAARQTFRLERWFIATPFYEVRITEDGKQRARKRSGLRPADFYETPPLELALLERDLRAVQAERWGGVGLGLQPEDLTMDDPLLPSEEDRVY